MTIRERESDSIGVGRGMSEFSAKVLAVLVFALCESVKCYAQTEQPSPTSILEVSPPPPGANAGSPVVTITGDVLESIYNVITEGMEEERGQPQTEVGTDELLLLAIKPLGCYIPGGHVVFGSGYKDVPAKTIAEWVYDLNEYVSANGGWTPNGWLEQPFSYKRIKKNFASAWWMKHSDGFSDLVGLAQDAWIYEAILDGAHIWSKYEELRNKGAGSAIDYEGKHLMLLDYMFVNLTDVFGP